MLSFHNDPAIKAKYLARVRAHAAADEIIQGTGWANGRGCAVGCTFEAYDHSRGPVEIGVPVWLMHLEDRIFEGLPAEEARKFPAQFLEAIPVGVDLETVKWKVALARHQRDLERLAGNKEPYAQQVRDAIVGVMEFCRAKLNGSAAPPSEESARSAARSAELAAARSAELAAELAVWSAELAAAWSAVWSARSAVWSVSVSEAAAAAWSAAESAAESAARSAGSVAAYRAERDVLLATLRAMGAT